MRPAASIRCNGHETVVLLNCQDVDNVGGAKQGQATCYVSSALLRCGARSLLCCRQGQT